MTGWFAEPRQAAYFVIAIACFGELISTAQLFAARKLLRQHRALSWSSVRRRYRFSDSGRIDRLLNIVFAYRNMMLILVIRMLSITALFGVLAAGRSPVLPLVLIVSTNALV